jgi:hypothetical protein
MSDQIQIPNELALRLSDWHSSMHDPVYAVSSSGLAKRPVPREVFERALAGMEANAVSEGTSEFHAGAREIVAAMKGILGTTESDELFESVAMGISRTVWAMAWGDEAERHDVSLSGCNLTHVAPDTPRSCLEACKASLTRVVQDSGRTIGELYEMYRSEYPNPYDLGHEIAMAMTGCGGEIDLERDGWEMPTYFEVDYYNYAHEWKSE